MTLLSDRASTLADSVVAQERNQSDIDQHLVSANRVQHPTVTEQRPILRTTRFARFKFFKPTSQQALTQTPVHNYYDVLTFETEETGEDDEEADNLPTESSVHASAVSSAPADKPLPSQKRKQMLRGADQKKKQNQV